MSSSRHIQRSDYTLFWHKAAEFRQAMEDAYAKQNWNALGLASVHCAISANDALIAFYGGRRASGTDHREAIGLLSEVVRSPETGKKALHLKRIIAKKSLIEYESKLFPAVDAKEVYQHALRFYQWAAKMLNMT